MRKTAIASVLLAFVFSLSCDTPDIRSLNKPSTVALAHVSVLRTSNAYTAAVSARSMDVVLAIDVMLKLPARMRYC